MVTLKCAGTNADTLILNSKGADDTAETLISESKYVEDTADNFDNDVSAPFVACFLTQDHFSCLSYLVSFETDNLQVLKSSSMAGCAQQPMNAD